MYKKCNINVFISCQSLGKLFTSPNLCFINCKTGMKTLTHGIVSIKGTTLYQVNTALWGLSSLLARTWLWQVPQGCPPTLPPPGSSGTHTELRILLKARATANRYRAGRRIPACHPGTSHWLGEIWESAWRSDKNTTFQLRQSWEWLLILSLTCYAVLASLISHLSEPLLASLTNFCVGLLYFRHTSKHLINFRSFVHCPLWGGMPFKWGN